MIAKLSIADFLSFSAQERASIIDLTLVVAYAQDAEPRVGDNLSRALGDCHHLQCLRLIGDDKLFFAWARTMEYHTLIPTLQSVEFNPGDGTVECYIKDHIFDCWFLSSEPISWDTGSYFLIDLFRSEFLGIQGSPGIIKNLFEKLSMQCLLQLKMEFDKFNCSYQHFGGYYDCISDSTVEYKNFIKKFVLSEETQKQCRDEVNARLKSNNINNIEELLKERLQGKIFQTLDAALDYFFSHFSTIFLTELGAEIQKGIDRRVTLGNILANYAQPVYQDVSYEDVSIKDIRCAQAAGLALAQGLPEPGDYRKDHPFLRVLTRYYLIGGIIFPHIAWNNLLPIIQEYASEAPDLTPFPSLHSFLDGMSVQASSPPILPLYAHVRQTGAVSSPMDMDIEGAGRTTLSVQRCRRRRSP